MSREAVIILMFDLPTKTRQDKKVCNKFRRTMKKKGYLIMQESVYVKHIHNITSFDSGLRMIDSIAPAIGDISVFKMPLNQFKEMATVRGSGAKYEKIYASTLFV